MSDSIRAKNPLGQNFLKDPLYLCKIADAAQAGPRDQVHEIGPGIIDDGAGRSKKENRKQIASALPLLAPAIPYPFDKYLFRDNKTINFKPWKKKRITPRTFGDKEYA